MPAALVCRLGQEDCGVPGHAGVADLVRVRTMSGQECHHPGWRACLVDGSAIPLGTYKRLEVQRREDTLSGYGRRRSTAKSGCERADGGNTDCVDDQTRDRADADVIRRHHDRRVASGRPTRQVVPEARTDDKLRAACWIPALSGGGRPRARSPATCCVTGARRARSFVFLGGPANPGPPRSARGRRPDGQRPRRRTARS